MKTKTYIIAILLAVGLTGSRAQDTWTQKADFGGVPRSGAVGFSIGSKGYIGTGVSYDHHGRPSYYQDFWEYDPATNTWTQKADFGGTARYAAVGFSIDSKGYIGTGSNSQNDFWEYDPATNTWTQKADFGGTARFAAAGFSIGSKGYIGTGTNGNGTYYKDFWEYTPSTNAWTQKTDFGGTGRYYTTGFSIDSKGYLGTGYGSDGKDFWEYDPATNTWTQKADYGGTAGFAAAGFSIGSKGYIGTGIDGNPTVTFWEYDPATNTWTQKADFGGTARAGATGFSIGSKGYLGTGASLSTSFKDFWEYTPGENNSGGCIPPPAGLVSWWAGDKTAEDVQGTNPGVLLNGTSFRPGKVGSGFALDGVNDWVTIPNSNSLSETRITLDAWVYPTGNVGLNRHIISKDYIGVGREYSLAINDVNKFAAFVTLPTGLVLLYGNTTPLLNTWYHVAMTHDGQKLRLYVNGVLDGAIEAVGDTVPTQVEVSIGGGAYGEFFKGIIDEAQIFSRALTDAEILAIYQAGADIFVASIDPSFQTRGHEYVLSTAVSIQDENGIGTSGATVNVKTLLPNGSELIFPAPTDESGTASFSFYTSETGLYKFKVIRVSHPTRVYDPSLNIETSDTLLIP
jgi:N-acetylneuraminic acid mutarotase